MFNPAAPSPLWMHLDAQKVKPDENDGHGSSEPDDGKAKADGRSEEGAGSSGPLLSRRRRVLQASSGLPLGLR